MSAKRQNDIYLPLWLILFAAIPIGAGVARLLQIFGMSIDLPDSARVLSQWRAIFVVHIVGSIVFIGLGAFQFSQTIRKHHKLFHILSGRIAFMSGLATALSALWLSYMMPPAHNSGTLLLIFRTLAAVGILLSVTLGFAAIRSRKIMAHRAWMTRGYALGLGTALQAFVYGGLEAFNGTPGTLERALIFGGCWLACLFFGEFTLRKTRTTPQIFST